jgi:hypothetical protein
MARHAFFLAMLEIGLDNIQPMDSFMVCSAAGAANTLDGGVTMNDFSRTTVRSLLRKGITLVGLQWLPDMASDMPMACGERGYVVNDNGTGRVLRFTDVMALASAGA